MAELERWRCHGDELITHVDNLDYVVSVMSLTD